MAACYQFPDIAQKDDHGKYLYEKLYRAIVFVLRDRFRLDLDGQRFPTTIADLQKIPVASSPTDSATHEKLPFVVATFGLLYQDNYRDPLMGKDATAIDVITGSLDDGHAKVHLARRWVEQAAATVQEFQGSKEMFEAVFSNLSTDDADNTVYSGQIAEVTRRLVEDGRVASDPQLKMRINNVLSVVLGDGVQGRASAIDVNLPSLDEGTTADILGDNVKALSVLYFAAQLEELKFFATADKVVEHFVTGMLPLSRGPGGEAIYEYMKASVNRLTEVERRSLYARAFGFAQGSVDEPLPNREFQDTWIRFLSGESQFVRLYGTYGTNGSGSKVVLQGPLVPVEQVFKSAKDLAVNLSLHGYGIAHFAAVELQKLVRDVKAMLSYDDVLKAYGVMDCWQLTERVSQLYLGGSVNGVQKRTMATAGANIIQWLAKNATVLAAPMSDTLTNLILKPGRDPIDDIATNVERWLAVTGTGDSSVEKFAEPVSMPTQATIPNLSLQAAVPDSLRSMLSQVSAGMPSLSMSGGVIPKA